jgi:hypothetical protein
MKRHGKGSPMKTTIHESTIYFAFSCRLRRSINAWQTRTFEGLPSECLVSRYWDARQAVQEAEPLPEETAVEEVEEPSEGGRIRWQMRHYVAIFDGWASGDGSNASR